MYIKLKHQLEIKYSIHTATFKYIIIIIIRFIPPKFKHYIGQQTYCKMRRTPPVHEIFACY